jgi:hypothetical protein
MIMSIEFKAWPKIPRATGEKVTITEKLDGTNACIVIQDGVIVGVQSRKRFITPSDDNYGFASWVEENKEDLLKLEDGYHYGEWAGLGIQKNPHNLDSKQFFLFNTFRWNSLNPHKPRCCNVVPVLYQGLLADNDIDAVLIDLKASSIKQGYTAEGIIVYYQNTKRYEKYTYNYVAGKWCSS